MPQPQRQASLPQFQPIYQQSYQLQHQHLQNNQRIQGNFQPQPIQQLHHNILPQHHPSPQQRVTQNPTNYQYSPTSYFTYNNKQPFTYSNNNAPYSRVSTPQVMVQPYQNQQHSVNTSPNTQKRGVSVPVKLSYQNSTPQQLKFSPISLDQNQSPFHLDSSPSKRK
jgi:hypothetical protein